MLHAWQHARTTDAANRRQQQVQHVVGQPPQQVLLFKYNIDAAIFDSEQKVDVCLRDEEGHFIAAMTTNKDVVMAAAEGEAWGLYQ
ncbi:hypothetical protein L195_g060903, partial [Trifolium pratense]